MQTSKAGLDTLSNLTATAAKTAKPLAADPGAASSGTSITDSADISKAAKAGGYKSSQENFARAKELEALGQTVQAQSGGKTAAGIGAGIAGGFLAESSGVDTFIHEGAHKLAIQKLYDGADITVQIDAFDNIGNFLHDPSGSNFKKILTSYDVYQDGAAGYTQYNYGTGASKLGDNLGPEKSDAVISAAGCVATEIPALAGFAAGFKLRKNHPVIGYALMTMTTLTHLNNTLYVASAISPSAAMIPGHDWASFAASTKINPVVTAVAFGAALPALGAAMYLVERHNEENAKNRLALSRLIADNVIGLKELETSLADYPKADQLKHRETQLEQLLTQESAGGEPKANTAGIRKASAELQKEYNKFSDFLIDRFKDKIEEEKPFLPEPPKLSLKESLGLMKQDIKESWERDKVGTALEAGSQAGSLALIGKAGLDVASKIAPAVIPAAGSIAGKVLSAVIPGAGILVGAHAVHKAAKTLANPEVSKFDKAMAVSSSAFTALSAAAMLIPGLGLPVALASLAGIAGTEAVKWIGHKIQGA